MNSSNFVTAQLPIWQSRQQPIENGISVTVQLSAAYQQALAVPCDFFPLEGALELLARRCLDERVRNPGFNPGFLRVTEQKTHQEFFANGPAREERQLRAK